MRLQRFLSQAGVASRRQAEELIRTGAVTVNGEAVSELGVEVGEKDRVEVSGRRVAPEKPIYRLLLKPRACLSNFEDKGERATLRRYLPAQETGLTVVGPLDFPSEGVLLLTTDGALADVMSRRHQKVPMTYHLKLQGSVGSDEIERLLRGWHAEDRQIKPVSVRGLATTGKNTWIEVVVAETRPRALKAIGDLLRHTVLKISRVRFGALSFEGLAMGEWRDLTKVEAAELREQAGLDAEDERGPAESSKAAGKSGRESAKLQAKLRDDEEPLDGARPVGARVARPPKAAAKPAVQEPRRGFRGRAWAGGEPGRKTHRRPERPAHSERPRPAGSAHEEASHRAPRSGAFAPRGRDDAGPRARDGREATTKRFGARAGAAGPRPASGRPPLATGSSEGRSPRGPGARPEARRGSFPREGAAGAGAERPGRTPRRPADAGPARSDAGRRGGGGDFPRAAGPRRGEGRERPGRPPGRGARPGGRPPKR